MPSLTKFKSNRDKPESIIKKIRKAVIRNLDRTFQEHVDLRDEATKGWSTTNKPKVTVELLDDKGFFGFRIKLEAQVAEGSTEGLSVYQLLNDGTDVRRAKMGQDFKPKTKPGQLGQFGPGGRPIVIKKTIELPGIKARNFEETINSMLEKPMEVRIEAGFRDGLS